MMATRNAIRDALAEELLAAFGIPVQDYQEDIANAMMVNLWPLITDEKMSIIGRERALMERAAKVIHKAAWKEFATTSLRETRRGYYFEVQVTTKDGEETGRVARITVELDRVEDT